MRPVSESIERPHLQAYPIRDTVFAHDAIEAIDAVVGDEPLAVELAPLVQERLRVNYPNAIVRMQDPFGQLRDPTATLYAYRDGRIRPDDPARERLYQALATARSTSTESGRLMEASRSMATHASGDEDTMGAGQPGDDDRDVSPAEPDPAPVYLVQPGSSLPG